MIRAFNIAAISVAIVLAFGLYKAKDEAAVDRARVAALQAEIAREREAVRVLKSEIAHLEDPARLRALAESRLGLGVIDPLRVVTLEDAPLMYEPHPGIDGLSVVAPEDGRVGDLVAGASASETRP